MRLRDGDIRNPSLAQVRELRDIIRNLGFNASVTIVGGEFGLQLDHDFDPEGVYVPAIYGRRRRKRRDKYAHLDCYHA